MFGGLIKPKPPVLVPRPIPRIIDVEGINMFAHMAPDPNNCYNIQMMQYRQRKNEAGDRGVVGEIKQLMQDKVDVKYAKHFEKHKYTNRIKKETELGMIAYEKSIDIRRDKLRGLLAKEERELYREVVDTSQRAAESTIADKLDKLNQIRNRKEAERAELAKVKTMQKYLGRCDEFRPVVIKQRLIDTKNVQLLQMQENEAKKESERELDKMWNDMKLKEIQAQNEREEQDQRKIQKIIHEFKEFSILQAKAKERRLLMEKLAKEEECRRLDKIREDIKQEELDALEAKRKKREELVKQIHIQMVEHEEEMKIKNAEVNKMTETYTKLANDELYKEQMKIKNKANTAYNDMLLYKKYLGELKQDKIDEEKRMNTIVAIAKKDIQQKEETEKCKFEQARKDLQHSVMEGRKEQIKYKRKQEEEKLKFKLEEEELCRKNSELNLKLKNEHTRQKYIAGQKYREDLQKQVAYTKLIKKREEDAQNRMLEDAKLEDKLYRSIVAEVSSGRVKVSPSTHPFRNVIENEKCPCPKQLY